MTTIILKRREYCSCPLSRVLDRFAARRVARDFAQNKAQGAGRPAGLEDTKPKRTHIYFVS
jgi:hypothetical protein